MDKETTGKLIREKRIEKGMTQTQLADELGVSNKAVSRWETGSNFPDITLLGKIAKILDIPIESLMQEEIPEKQITDSSTEVFEASQQKISNKRKFILTVAAFCIVGIFLAIYFVGVKSNYFVSIEETSSADDETFYAEKQVNNDELVHNEETVYNKETTSHSENREPSLMLTEVSYRLNCIQSENDLKELENLSNAFVKNLKENIYIAVVCFDKNGEPCVPHSFETVIAKYALYQFDNEKVTLYQRTYNAMEISLLDLAAYGVCEWEGDWYEVTDYVEGETDSLRVENITSGEPGYWVYDDRALDSHLRSNTYFFMDSGMEYIDKDKYSSELEKRDELVLEDNVLRVMVGELENSLYGKVLDVSQVQSKEDLQELLELEELTYFELDKDTYLIVHPWNEHGNSAMGYLGIEYFYLGYLEFNQEELVWKNISIERADESICENLGVGKYEEDYYLIGKVSDSDNYVIKRINSDFERYADAQDEMVLGILENAKFFAIQKEFNDPYKGEKKVWGILND